jgi:hypothetical protein
MSLPFVAVHGQGNEVQGVWREDRVFPSVFSQKPNIRNIIGRWWRRQSRTGRASDPISPQAFRRPVASPMDNLIDGRFKAVK